jgi:hypothetical protein
MREVAWCILNAGMREKVIRRLFPRIASCFWNFQSSEDIVATGDTCVRLGLEWFGHRGKLEAIVDAARRIKESGGFAAWKSRLEVDPLGECEAFSYIGPTTKWHLARNLGIDCVKPDRHLVRLAKASGFRTPWHLCSHIATAVKERLGVVDLVLWRHLALRCKCASMFLPQLRAISAECNCLQPVSTRA